MAVLISDDTLHFKFYKCEETVASQIQKRYKLQLGIFSCLL